MLKLLWISDCHGDVCVMSMVTWFCMDMHEHVWYGIMYVLTVFECNANVYLGLDINLVDHLAENAIAHGC